MNVFLGILILSMCKFVYSLNAINEWNVNEFIHVSFLSLSPFKKRRLFVHSYFTHTRNTFINAFYVVLYLFYHF